jgi:phospholipase C
VYEAIRKSQIWNETLFLITYDEHGGFFDHVAPPMHAGIPNPGPVASNGFTFDRLGVRVPLVAVSPWIEKVPRRGGRQGGRVM